MSTTASCYIRDRWPFTKTRHRFAIRAGMISITAASPVRWGYSGYTYSLPRACKFRVIAYTGTARCEPVSVMSTQLRDSTLYCVFSRACDCARIGLPPPASNCQRKAASPLPSPPTVHMRRTPAHWQVTGLHLYPLQGVPTTFYRRIWYCYMRQGRFVTSLCCWGEGGGGYLVQVGIQLKMLTALTCTLTIPLTTVNFCTGACIPELGTV